MRGGKCVLTDISDDLVQTSVVLQGQQTALEGRNVDREVEVGTLGVLLPHLEAVFQDRVHNASNPKGGLNDVWNVLLLLNCDSLLLETEMFL